MEHLLDNHITTQYPEIDHICEDFNNCIISAGRNSKLYFLFQVLLDTAVLNSSLDNTEYNLKLMHRLKETHALITEKGIFAPPPEMFCKFGMKLRALSSDKEKQNYSISKLRQQIKHLIKTDTGLRAFLIREHDLMTESMYYPKIEQDQLVPRCVDPEHTFAVVFGDERSQAEIEKIIEDFYKSLHYKSKDPEETSTSRNYTLIPPNTKHLNLTVTTTLYPLEHNNKHYLFIELKEEIV